jgi:hypothetical protein
MRVNEIIIIFEKTEYANDILHRSYSLSLTSNGTFMLKNLFPVLSCHRNHFKRWQGRQIIQKIQWGYQIGIEGISFWKDTRNILWCFSSRNNSKLSINIFYFLVHTTFAVHAFTFHWAGEFNFCSFRHNGKCSLRNRMIKTEAALILCPFLVNITFTSKGSKCYPTH